MEIRVPLSVIGAFGQILAVQRHYIGYSELLKIRYSNIPCTIMVGAEDQIIQKVNYYMLQRVYSLSSHPSVFYVFLLDTGM